jgi:hypothetical protein
MNDNATPSGDTFYPEPIWAIHLIANGIWVRIEPEEIRDYRVNPLEDGWETRYRESAIDKLKAAGLPPRRGTGND